MIEENVLRKLCCPHCDSTGPFKVVASFIINNSVTFLFRNSNLIWNNDAEIQCGCGQIGRVFDFLIDYTQVIPHHQQIKSIEVYNLELQNCLASLVGCYSFEDIDNKLYSGDVPALKKAIAILGLTDPFSRSDLVRLFVNKEDEEINDLADTFLD